MSLSLLRLYLNDETAPYVFDDPTLQDILDRAEGEVGAAAGEGWRIKAGKVAEWYDVELDGSALSRGQVAKHCLDMASFYEATSGSGGKLTNTRLQVTPTPAEEAEF